jgi:hypothetical protein
MYNLTVDIDHTYYVLADATPVLVDNACSGTSGNTPATLNGTAIHGQFSEFLNDVGGDYSGARTPQSGNRIDASRPLTDQSDNRRRYLLCT